MSRAAGAATYSKTGLMIRFKYLFLLITIFAIGSFIVITYKGIDIIFFNNKSRSPWAANWYDIASSNERYTINTEGCSIPALNVLDESIRRFVKYPSELKSCPNVTTALLGYNKSKIWIKYENLKKLYKPEKLFCCYYSFYRPTSVKDVTSWQIDNRVKYKECIQFNDAIEVKDEFVKVTCFLYAIKIYEQFFLFAPMKQFIGRKAVEEIPDYKTGYNIMILGIDAVSRLNFHRTMPNTASFLNKIGAVELLGYNKVGDNTFPNLIPMLMGIKDTELKKTCYPHSEANFDNCPFIWEWYKQAGYYTALAEDSSWLGTFNYVKSGFIKTPTDYYIHTFMNEAENNVGLNKDVNAYLCMNERYFYKVLLDYVHDITETLKHKRLFGFFWEVTMSHDYLNYPVTMDNDYLNLFVQLESSGYLNNTIVFFVSDHGIRWGNIRLTKQGRLEERLPFLYILTPPSFRKNYTEAYNNLKLNSKRLTTPFDVHATLLHLLDINNINNDVIAARNNKSYSSSRSISMFLPIPSKRTCQKAGIDDHWCTCLKDVAIPKDSPKAVEAANTLVIMLNFMLKGYPQCAKLIISDIVDVKEVHDDKSSKNEVTSTVYVVVIKTDPGGGVFEATLRHYKEQQNWELSGTVSRLNKYGDQSRCVHQYQVKLYCYCKQ